MLVAVSDSRLSGSPGLSSADVRITTSQLGAEAYVVAARGDVDLYSAPELQAQLSSVTESGGRRLIVDLTSADFLDSTAIGLLVASAADVERHGGRLVLVCDNPVLLRSIDVTGLAPRFRIERSLGEAVGRLFDTLTP